MTKFYDRSMIQKVRHESKKFTTAYFEASIDSSLQLSRKISSRVLHKLPSCPSSIVLFVQSVIHSRARDRIEQPLS